MPNERSRPPRRDGARGTGGRSSSGGRSDGRSTGGRSSGGRSGGGRSTDGRGAGGRSSGGRSSGGAPGQRPAPRNEAERRAAAIRAKRRRPGDEAPERPAPSEPRPAEEWVDEGSIRDEAAAAAGRASSSSTPGRSRGPRVERVEPEVAAMIAAAVGDRRAERLVERLASAAHALERDRLDEARRLITPIVREVHGVSAVHEVAGLVQYRLGRWKEAAKELEAAQALHESIELLPVLADCYRAQRRWAEVDRVWNRLKAASPAHEVMAEGRIVVAGSLADRGDVRAAIELLAGSATPPKRVRDHHLRQWYALADLYDRSGDTVSASRWFRMVASHDPDFVDVTDRLRGLGR